MLGKSKIEWTQSTWNPVTGCSKVSEGCLNCYAERMARRLMNMGQKKYRNQFDVTIHPYTLEEPLKTKKRQMIFVSSMSDLFHEKVPVAFIQDVFAVMNRADWHTFQVLTKRSERLLELDAKIDWIANIWAGVSVENRDYTKRIEHLKRTHAKVKFLSIEPLLGPLQNLNLDGIDWVIVGGESGPKSRPMQESWVVDIRDQCLEAGTPFFFKQWGGTNKKKTGRLLEGRVWDQTPPR